MKTAAQLREMIDAAREECHAIAAVAEKDNRELTVEEAARVNELADKTIPDCESRLATAQKIEQERKAIQARQIDARLTEQRQQAGGDVDPDNRFAHVRVPAKAKAHGPLKAFTGPDAERDAYISGQVILAGVYGNQHAIEFCRNHGLQVNASMTTGTNSAGGFLVPDEMQRTLIRLREERGVFPQFANNVPMGADIIRTPRLLADVTAYWVGEGVEITASDPTLGLMELMARKLGALTKISTELDEDSVVSVGDMVTQSMAYAMADKIDEAGFNGDGTSTYGGVTGLKNALDSNAIQDAVSGNVSALTLDLADFEATVGKYPQYSSASPRWFMHSAVYYASAARLMNAAGGNTNVTLASGAPVTMFLGYPVTFTQVMPSTTGSSVSTILAYFGDLRLGCTYGTRRSARMEMSTERYFELDMIGLKMTERIAINVHERGDSIRTRPIVALKTAAS